MSKQASLPSGELMRGCVHSLPLVRSWLGVPNRSLGVPNRSLVGFLGVVLVFLFALIFLRERFFVFAIA